MVRCFLVVIIFLSSSTFIIECIRCTSHWFSWLSLVDLCWNHSIDQQTHWHFTYIHFVMRIYCPLSSRTIQLSTNPPTWTCHSSMLKIVYFPIIDYFNRLLISRNMIHQRLTFLLFSPSSSSCHSPFARAYFCFRWFCFVYRFRFSFADSIFDRVCAYRTDPIPTIMQIPKVHRLPVNLECWHFHLYVFIILHQIVPEKEHTRRQAGRSEWEYGWFVSNSGS